MTKTEVVFETGRGKLSGVHAGLVILTPVDGAAPSDSHQQPTAVGHTPLEPPPSILHSVFSAVKDVFSSAAPAHAAETSVAQEVPLPPPPPSFKPMSWGAVDSYGEPAALDGYPNYDPRNPYPPFDRTSKHSWVPNIHKKKGLTQAKIQKINRNLSKLDAYMHNNVHRSLEDANDFSPQFGGMVKMGRALRPNPVTSDGEIGVLPAELLPDLDTDKSTTATPTITTPTPTTNTTTTNATTSDDNRRKDVKFILRGNKIVQV